MSEAGPGEMKAKEEQGDKSNRRKGWKDERDGRRKVKKRVDTVAFMGNTNIYIYCLQDKFYFNTHWPLTFGRWEVIAATK